MQKEKSECSSKQFNAKTKKKEKKVGNGNEEQRIVAGNIYPPKIVCDQS